MRSDGKSWSKKYRQGANGQNPVVEEFLKAMLVEERQILDELEVQAKIRMSPENWDNFNNASHCWICEKSLFIPEYLDSVGVWDVNTGHCEGK